MTDSLLRAVAGWSLPGSPVEYERPLDGRADLTILRRHRLIGVAAAGVDSGEIPVDNRDALRDAHRDAMTEVLLLEDALLDASTVLTDAGIEHRVLKGAALAHQLDITDQRTFGDSDMLVRGAQITAAVEVLAAAGGTRIHDGLGPRFDERYAKSITMAWRGATELDLHRTLAPGPFGLRIVLDDLFDRSVSFDLAGVAVPTLDLERHLLHGAIHLALGDTAPRWGNARDLALILAAADLDSDRVVRLAQRWGCEAPVAQGLSLAARIGAAHHPLLDWADGHRPTRRDRRALQSYQSRARRFRAQAWASVRDLPWAEKPGYAVSILRRD